MRDRHARPRAWSAALVGMLIQVAPAHGYEPPPDPVMEARRKAGLPIRDGFTLELGIGGSLMQGSLDGGGTVNRVGPAQLGISLGGFINNRLAILVRISGATFWADNVNGKTVPYQLTFLGVQVQYWFHDRFYAALGAGIGSYGIGFFMRDDEDPSSIRGSVFSLRAGYAFANWENHSLRVAIEIIPAFLSGGKLVGEVLAFEWQWF